MDDIEERAKTLIAEYGDQTTGRRRRCRSFKQAVQDFLNNGPGRSSGARHCSSA